MVDRKLAAMPAPSQAELEQLRRSGFGLVVNLMDRPGLTRMSQAAGLEALHLPVADMGAPSMEQIEQFVTAVEDSLARRRPVMVHCMGGRGRTGTLIACYLVKKGMKPWDAIKYVRKRRHGSVETPEQEDAVVKYGRYVSVRRGLGEV